MLLPDGKPPFRLKGDLTKLAGNQCPENSAGDGRYVELTFDRERTPAGKHGFLLIGREELIKDLRMNGEPFKKIEQSLPCSHKGYVNHVFQAESAKITYYEQKTEACDWQHYGILADKTCYPVGKTIADCPKIGPKTEGLYGTPKDLYFLKSDLETEVFIVTDGTFWEYYGYQIARLEKTNILDHRSAFEDSCNSH